MSEVDWKPGDTAWHWTRNGAESFVVKSIESLGPNRDILCYGGWYIYAYCAYKDRIALIEHRAKTLELAMRKAWESLRTGNTAAARDILSHYMSASDEEEDESDNDR